MFKCGVVLNRPWPASHLALPTGESNEGACPSPARHAARRCLGRGRAVRAWRRVRPCPGDGHAPRSARGVGEGSKGVRAARSARGWASRGQRPGDGGRRPSTLRPGATRTRFKYMLASRRADPGLPSFGSFVQTCDKANENRHPGRLWQRRSHPSLGGPSSLANEPGPALLFGTFV